MWRAKNSVIHIEYLLTNSVQIPPMNNNVQQKILSDNLSLALTDSFLISPPTLANCHKSKENRAELWSLSITFGYFICECVRIYNKN